MKGGILDLKINDYIKIYNEKYNSGLRVYNNNEKLFDLIDGEGYRYRCLATVVFNCNRRDCILQKFFRNNIYTLENIKNYLIINKKNFHLHSKNINNAIEKVEWNCKNHGIFKTSWNCIKNGQGCPICGREIVENSRRHSYEYIKNELKKRNLTLLSDGYKNNMQKIDMICDIHKDRGKITTTYANIISGGGCIICNRIKKNYTINENGHIIKDPYIFEKKVYSIFGEKYKLLEKYSGDKNKIRVYCNDCEKEFYIRPSHLLDGHGCGSCYRSLGERQIEKYLKDNGVNFIQEYRFDDCRGIKKALPFDFAVFDNESNISLLIEYQGKQHYDPVVYPNMTKEEAEGWLKLRIMYDDIKRKYCSENNIKLLEIHYKDYKNIESILERELFCE